MYVYIHMYQLSVVICIYMQYIGTGVCVKVYSLPVHPLSSHCHSPPPRPHRLTRPQALEGGPQHGVGTPLGGGRGQWRALPRCVKTPGRGFRPAPAGARAGAGGGGARGGGGVSPVDEPAAAVRAPGAAGARGRRGWAGMPRSRQVAGARLAVADNRGLVWHRGRSCTSTEMSCERPGAGSRRTGRSS